MPILHHPSKFGKLRGYSDGFMSIFQATVAFTVECAVSVLLFEISMKFRDDPFGMSPDVTIGCLCLSITATRFGLLPKHRIKDFKERSSMMKKLLVLLLVFGLACVTNANPSVSEDFDSLAPGALNGQGGGIGWSGNWNANSSWQIVAGGSSGSTNYIEDVTVSTTYAERNLANAITGSQNYIIEMVSDCYGTPNQDWSSTQGIAMIDLGDPDDDIALQIKFEGPDHMFRINNEDMINFMDGGSAKNGSSGYKGHGAYDWIKWKIAYTAATTTYDVYWEKTDGSMGLIGSHVGHRYSATGKITNLSITSPKLDNTNGGIGHDNIIINPEPATILMLGLGGLALIRKRRP